MDKNKELLNQWIQEKLTEQDKKEIENLKDFKERYKKSLTK